ncbi:hypothetical protein NMG60_11000423 [Bertholletia excelsa]
MKAVAKVYQKPHLHQPLLTSPLLARPSSSLSFRTPLSPPTSPFKLPFLIRASPSSFSDTILPTPKDPNIQFTKTPNIQFTKNPNFSPFYFLKPTLIAAIAAAAAFSARFNPKPLVAAAISQPIETTEEKVTCQNDDVQALRNLMEEKVKAQKVDEAISIVDQLIKLEPSDVEWPLLKAHMRCYNGDVETAKSEFNKILAKDSLRVEAYHGLVMAASQGDSETELKEIEKRVGEAMEVCRREGKVEDLREFRLLIAQIRVIEGNYNDALRLYEGLVKEEPRDFRPYLCQGIVYMLLRKNDEAEKQFEKYRSLVPQGHPYAKYFDQNLIATQLLGQNVESERVGLKN